MSDSIKEMFPDWESLDFGEWSRHSVKLEYRPGVFFELGLYREANSNDEYAGTYTLQAFDGDSVIFCQTVG